jgi:hypothetical protein
MAAAYEELQELRSVVSQLSESHRALSSKKRVRFNIGE